MRIKTNRSKTVAIVQARLTSTRLPGKVLLPLGDSTVLEQVVKRIKQTIRVDEIVIAIPDNEANKKLALFIRDNIKGASCYKYPGSENDVIDRTIQAADSVKADVIVDITSDCPCVDPALIDMMVDRLRADNNIRYISNVVVRSFPDGFDVQVYETKLLKEIDPYVQIEKDRTHSGWNIVQYAQYIPRLNNNIVGINAPVKYHYPAMRVTLDTPEDYVLLSKIFYHFRKSKYFSWKDITKFVLREG